MKGRKKGREKKNGRNMNLVAFGSNREKRLTLIDSSASSPRTHLEVPVVWYLCLDLYARWNDATLTFRAVRIRGPGLY